MESRDASRSDFRGCFMGRSILNMVVLELELDLPRVPMT